MNSSKHGVLALAVGLVSGALMPVPPMPACTAQAPGPPEWIHFPNLVTPQKLKAVDNLASGKHFALRFNTRPVKNPARPHHIQIPEAGPFQLTVQPGPRFAITDADATDGTASVTLPQDVYNAYLQLEGKRSKDQVRLLKLEDDLYYVKDELIRVDKGAGSFSIQASKDPKPAKLQIEAVCSDSPNDYRAWKITNPNSTEVEYSWEVAHTDLGDEGLIAPPGVSYLETETDGGNDTLKVYVEDKLQDAQLSKPDVCLPGQDANREESTWWSLGARSLPVPTDWHSDNGSSQVFKLNNQGISNFEMRWIRTPGQRVDFPPGMAEIGPAGGTVELPGIGKLILPPGALNRKMMISMHQESKANYTINKSRDGKILTKYIFVSPVVKIEPLGQNLSQNGKLFLKPLPHFENVFQPTITWFQSLVANDWELGDFAYYPEEGELDRWNTEEFPGRVDQLGYYSKQLLVPVIDQNFSEKG